MSAEVSTEPTSVPLPPLPPLPTGGLVVVGTGLKSSDTAVNASSADDHEKTEHGKTEKRGRGRPRSAKRQAVEVEEEGEVEVEEEDVEQKEVEDKMEEDEGRDCNKGAGKDGGKSSSQTEPKRGRGRPPNSERKKVKEVQEEDDEEEEEDGKTQTQQSAQKKKARGRPRRKPVEEEEEEVDVDVIDDSASQDEESGKAAEEEDTIMLDRSSRMRGAKLQALGAMFSPPQRKRRSQAGAAEQNASSAAKKTRSSDRASSQPSAEAPTTTEPSTRGRTRNQTSATGNTPKPDAGKRSEKEGTGKDEGKKKDKGKKEEQEEEGEEEGQDEADGGDYEVEDICSVTEKDGKITEYEVRWKGYPSSANSFVSAEDVSPEARSLWNKPKASEQEKFYAADLIAFTVQDKLKDELDKYSEKCSQDSGAADGGAAAAASSEPGAHVGVVKVAVKLPLDRRVLIALTGHGSPVTVGTKSCMRHSLGDFRKPYFPTDWSKLLNKDGICAQVMGDVDAYPHVSSGPSSAVFDPKTLKLKGRKPPVRVQRVTLFFDVEIFDIHRRK